MSHFLGGCTGQQQGSGEGSAVRSLLAGAGRSIGAARAYDQLTRAMEDGNAEAFLHATSELQQNGAWNLADRLVQRLVQTAGTTADAQLLNSLGYTLAEKGQHRQQFAAAEALTRKAVKIYDDSLGLFQEGAATRPDTAAVLNQAKFSRANIRDSLAWALFRQGRYEKALVEQTKAVAEAVSVGRELKSIPRADLNRSFVELHYHLGEIYRALGRLDEARTQYRLAQKADVSHALTTQALRNLPKSTAPPAKTTPSPNAQLL
jgi:tetratricopeptide (TPR) repeat protein